MNQVYTMKNKDLLIEREKRRKAKEETKRRLKIIKELKKTLPSLISQK